MLSDHWGVIRSDPLSIRAVLQWKCINIMGNFAISGSQSDVLGLMFPIRKQNEEEFLWGVSRNRFLKFQNFTLHLKNLYSYIWNNGFNSISQEAIKSSFFLVKKFIKCSTPGKNTENIHGRFQSWLRCRFQDMLECALNL